MFDLLRVRTDPTSAQVDISVYICLFTFQTGISQMDILWQRYFLGIFHRKSKCILTITVHHYPADRETGLNFRGLVSTNISRLTNKKL